MKHFLLHSFPAALPIGAVQNSVYGCRPVMRAPYLPPQTHPSLVLITSHHHFFYSLLSFLLLFSLLLLLHCHTHRGGLICLMVNPGGPSTIYPHYLLLCGISGSRRVRGGCDTPTHLRLNRGLRRPHLPQDRGAARRVIALSHTVTPPLLFSSPLKML